MCIMQTIFQTKRNLIFEMQPQKGVSQTLQLMQIL